jgi:hypothetical protein
VKKARCKKNPKGDSDSVVLKREKDGCIKKRK